MPLEKGQTVLSVHKLNNFNLNRHSPDAGYVWAHRRSGATKPRTSGFRSNEFWKRYVAGTFVIITEDNL